MGNNVLNFLISWIGITDLKASKNELDEGELGPIGQVVSKRKFDNIILIADHNKSDISHYSKWVNKLTDSEVKTHKVKLRSPTDFGDIYESVVDVISPIQNTSNLSLTFHLSPGTPAMAAVWIILSKTRFPAELIESSKEGGVRTASVPFDISAEFIPDLFRKSDESLQRLTSGLPPESPEFDNIIHQSNIMQKVVARARRVALRSIPVLIEGESGTGKELFKGNSPISSKNNVPPLALSK